MTGTAEAPTLIETEDADFDAAMDTALAGMGDAPEVIEEAAPSQVQQAAPQTLFVEDRKAPAPAPVNEEPPARTIPETLPDRFYTKHLPTPHKVMLEIAMKNPDLSPSEISAMANQQLGLIDETGAPTEAAQSNPSMDALEAELEEVRAKLIDFAEDGGIGSTYNREVYDLNTRQAELIADLRLMQREQVVTQRQQATEVQRIEDAAVEAAYDMFPALADDNDPFTLATTQRMEEINALERAAAADPSIANDPDAALDLAKRRHPQFALLIAQEIAREQGIAPTQAKPGRSPQNPMGRQTQRTAAQAEPGPMPFSGATGQAHRVSIRDVSPDDVRVQRLQAAAQSDDLADIDAFLNEDLGGSGAAYGVTFR
jgi:hypothetical protein